MKPRIESRKELKVSSLIIVTNASMLLKAQ